MANVKAKKKPAKPAPAKFAQPALAAAAKELARVRSEANRRRQAAREKRLAKQNQATTLAKLAATAYQQPAPGQQQKPPVRKAAKTIQQIIRETYGPDGAQDQGSGLVRTTRRGGK